MHVVHQIGQLKSPDSKRLLREPQKTVFTFANPRSFADSVPPKIAASLPNP
jgi:hypothetical protein